MLFGQASAVQVKTPLEAADESICNGVQNTACVDRMGVNWMLSTRNVPDEWVAKYLENDLYRLMRRVDGKLMSRLFLSETGGMELDVFMDNDKVYESDQRYNATGAAYLMEDLLNFLMTGIVVEKEFASQQRALESSKPAKPQAIGDAAFQIELDFDEAAFPELAVYKNMLFEVDPSDKRFNP